MHILVVDVWDRPAIVRPVRSVMKLETIVIGLIFLPGLALAQDASLRESAPYASQPQADPYQVAYVARSEKAFIELNASAASRKIFTSNPDLYSSASAHTDRVEAGIIRDWRIRMFRMLGAYSGQRGATVADGDRLLSNNEIEERTDERKTVARAVVKETLKFTQERLPEIDKIVKSLKLEVSTEMLEKKSDTEESAVDRTADAAGKKRTVPHSAGPDSFYLKTGLRVPVDNGKLGIVSETDAKYGKLSAFFEVHLDGQYDNTMGLVYVLGRALNLRVERQVSHSTDPVTNYKTNTQSELDMVKLVCTF
jgi:hypothetical protein